jgi:hypothetical protein
MLYEIHRWILIENDEHLYLFVLNEFFQIFVNDHRINVDKLVLSSQLLIENLNGKTNKLIKIIRFSTCLSSHSETTFLFIFCIKF